MICREQDNSLHRGTAERLRKKVLLLYSRKHQNSARRFLLLKSLRRRV